MPDPVHQIPRPPNVRESSGRCDTVIVGAGISGMYMLHRLRGLGLTVRMFEQGSDIGGTWYWNRYPGARCDVESMDYSYSFSPELEQEWEWTERYPTQPEILRYLDHVAERFDLRRGIDFDTRVTSAVFDEPSRRWLIRTEHGEVVSARFTVMATGCLSVPKRPELEGLDGFRGRVLHTARWPHEGVDLTGQEVAVIGTGSSGIQSIPVIAEQASRLTVFQRTANFSLPAHSGALDPEAQRKLKAGYREYRRRARESGAGVPGEAATDSALDADPDERHARYAAAWETGGLFGLSGSYTDIRTNADANETAAEFIRARIRETVDDPDVARTLSPTSHPFGTKRPCLDSGYYATYNRDDVTLVDLTATPILAGTPTGIRTSAADHDVDSIVFATGFDAMTGALLAIDIVGRGGLRLRDKWAAGPRTYLGIGIAGFPNLFTITGPGSPSVLSNMMVSIEQHVDWIADCIGRLRDRGVGTIEATAEAEDAWVRHVDELGRATLYPKADSWYMGANVPGKPRVFMPYVGGVGTYRTVCDEVADAGYRGFTLTGPDPAGVR